MLQTKKRYVGYMYEIRDQKEPVFDAKGIETVRRDTCPAVAKVWLLYVLHSSVFSRTANLSFYPLDFTYCERQKPPLVE